MIEKPVVEEEPETTIPHSLASLAELLKREDGNNPEKPTKPMVTRGESWTKPETDRLPPINFLSMNNLKNRIRRYIHQLAGQIETTLTEFGVPSTVTGYRIGPTVTQFAVEPGFIEKIGVDGNITKQKIRVAQISALSRDLALALKAKRLRIEAPVPGQSFLGIEIPNSNNAVVRLAFRA